MKSKFSRKCGKYIKWKKSHKKTRRNKRGGFLRSSNLNIGGINFGRKSGVKSYNPDTGKWENRSCYYIGPFPFFCKNVDPSA